MAVTQYIGSRYVPVFADPEEWNISREYEPLTIVTNKGDSYTSKQSVPSGIQLDNNRYWAHTANFNAQLESYRKIVNEYKDKVKNQQSAFITYDSAVKANLNVGNIFNTANFSESDGFGWLYEVTDVEGSKTIPYGNIYARPLPIDGCVAIESFYGSLENDTTNKIEKILSSGYKNLILIGSCAVTKSTSIPTDVKLSGFNVPNRNDTSSSFRMMNSNAGLVLNGISISNVRFDYPNKFIADTDYAPAITVGEQNYLVTLRNISFYGANIGVKSHNVSGRVSLENIYGWCSGTVFSLRHNYEITYVNNVLITPHAMANIYDTPEKKQRSMMYSYMNTVMFDVQERTDWIYCNNVFAFGIHQCFVLESLVGGDFNNIGCDGCWQGFQIRGSSNVRFSISNLSMTRTLPSMLWNTLPFPDNMYFDCILSNVGSVNISNVSLWGTADSMFYFGGNVSVNISNVIGSFDSANNVYTNKNINSPLVNLVISKALRGFNVSHMFFRIPARAPLNGGVFTIRKECAITNISDCMLMYDAATKISSVCQFPEQGTSLQLCNINNTTQQFLSPTIETEVAQRFVYLTDKTKVKITGRGNHILANIDDNKITLQAPSDSKLDFELQGKLFNRNMVAMH
jgi:hypothetical protein